MTIFDRVVPINEFIYIRIPDVGEIIEGYDSYYSAITMLTSMPIDMMVTLDEAGIDFEEIDEWQLFLLLFPGLQEENTSLIFGDLDLKKFDVVINTQNQELVLRDNESGAVIDRAILNQIANVLREMHGLVKNTKKPGNKEAKEYMLERAKRKAKRNRNKKPDTWLDDLIVAMVNTEQFKYDFESVRDLTIYQFNESVKQVVKKVNYMNTMHGVYAGTVSIKDIKQKDLNWLSNK